jgi:ubiquinone/menaquinone biosynthesis C-methylase UbiE
MSEFDERAADWDTPERVQRAHILADAIRRQVPLTSTMRAIDIGAGTGLLGLELLADLGSVTLTDPSEGMIEAARSRIEAEGLVDATAYVYDVPSIQLPPGAPFDLAVSLMALHHVADTAATLASIHAMLVPGGRIALIDLDEEDGSFHDPDQPGIHHQGFDRASLVGMARAAGFVDVDAPIVGEVEREGRLYPLFLLIGRKA